MKKQFTFEIQLLLMKARNWRLKYIIYLEFKKVLLFIKKILW